MLGDRVDDLVEADAEEVGEHDLDDRPVAGQRQAERGADEAGLGDRGVANAGRAEFLIKTETRLERPAGLTDVLTHDQRLWIAPHLLLEGRDDRFAVGDLLGAHGASAGSAVRSERSHKNVVSRSGTWRARSKARASGRELDHLPGRGLEAQTPSPSW